MEYFKAVLLVGGSLDGTSVSLPYESDGYLVELDPEPTTLVDGGVERPVLAERCVEEYCQRILPHPRDSAPEVFAPRDMSMDAIMTMLINNYAPRGKK